MVEDHDAFLKGVNEFLSAYEGPTDTGELQTDITTCGSDDLLISSHQLLAETEALLSSCKASAVESVATNDSSSNSSDASNAGVREGHSAEDKENHKLVDNRRRAAYANAARRRLKYCNKLKDEKHLLKQQEKDLLVELNKLQTRRKSEMLWKNTTRKMSVWKAIATRQLQSRLLAEKERHRLRNTVASRNAMIQRLEEAVRKELQSSEKEVCLLDADDTALFERFLREMDHAYAQTDAELETWRIDNALQASFSDQRYVRHDNVQIFENLDVQLTPFDCKSTCDAMWRSMWSYRQREKHQHYKNVLDPENTIAVKFKFFEEREDGREQVPILIRIVFRRYIEQDRMVLVWRANNQGESELSDFQADETGWIVVRPNKTHPEDSASMPTVVQTFLRFIPSAVTDASDSEQKLHEFMKLAELVGVDEGSELVRMMESLLLDDKTAIK